MINRLYAGLLAGLVMWAMAGCASAPKSTAESAAAPSTAAAAKTDASSYAAAPSTTASQTTTQRKQFKGTTDFPVSGEATKDKKFLTPLPDGFLDSTAYLPPDLRMLLPFEGSIRVMTGYGYESNSWTHQTIGNLESANDFFAIDFDMPVGTPILAPAPGRIVTSQDRTSTDSYGMYIVIDHGNGIHSIYAHLSKLEYVVDHGTPEVRVERGQKIGESGKSGVRVPHLHFGIHKDSRISHSGCDVAGQTVVPEPLDGYYGIRSKHVLTSTNKMK